MHGINTPIDLHLDIPFIHPPPEWQGRLTLSALIKVESSFGDNNRNIYNWYIGTSWEEVSQVYLGVTGS
jgi:hypothetical protein